MFLTQLSPNPVSDCIYSIEDRVMEMNTDGGGGGGHPIATEARTDSPPPHWQDEPGTRGFSKAYTSTVELARLRFLRIAIPIPWHILEELESNES